MEQGDGGDGAAAAADAGEDRLSALHNDLLVLILSKLTTPEAAQTIVLSHRWRRIWALLPVLCFFKAPEPHWLRNALDDHKVLLSYLLVFADSATPESLAVWMPAAARRVCGHMSFKIDGPEEDAGEEEAAKRGAFELPCFEQATKISFFLGFQGLAMPLTGVFARLTELYLFRVWFHGPGELSDAVSSPRCPCLQSLTVENSRGLRDLAIHSDSMLRLKLRSLHALSQLTVVAPVLDELTVICCFLNNPPVAKVSSPLLTRLVWGDQYDPSSVHFDKMAHLQCLGVLGYCVYGQMFMHNQSCLSLLQRFKGIKSLSLPLVYPRDIENYDYFVEGMAVLPNIAFLCLMIRTNGHAFGASAFHVLRLCTGISLKLELAKANAVCLSDCICFQLVEWETEELLLNHLEEVEIYEWRGTQHEVAFVKRLFDWGTKLKEMRVNFPYFTTSKVNAKDLYQTIQSFSRPGVCVKFYRDGLLYAPKD